MSGATSSSAVLAARPSSAGAARKWLSDTLTSWDCPEDSIETALLLTSELVTNAVLHAGSDVNIRVRVGDDIRVEVHDDSKRQLVRRRVHDKESTIGRGLALVEALASDYGSETVPGNGKIVWFTVGGSGASIGWVPEPAQFVPRVTVTLKHLPLVLYEVMREHNDALLREYTLESFADDNDCRYSADQIAEAQVVRDRWVDAFERAVSALRDDAGKPSHLDVQVQFASAHESRLTLLAEVFADAERLAERGVLLTRPALPELRTLRDWMMRQCLRQLSGAKPQSWQYADFVDDSPRLPSLGSAVDWVNSSDEAVIAGNRDNRIVAASTSALASLGWTAEDLLGRRIVSIVPPRLRETHVAGFTRHLVAGHTTILGDWVQIAALHRDGHEVEVRLRVESRKGSEGAEFLAWFEFMDG